MLQRFLWVTVAVLLTAAPSGAQLVTFTGHTDRVYAVAFSPDGTKVLTGSSDRTAKLWDAATGAEICTFTGHTGGVHSVAFSPDGTKVLTGSRDNTAKLWDMATGAEIRSLTGHTGGVHSVAFSPDGTKVLTGSLDNTVKLWDTATGAEIRTFGGHTGRVASVAFSPDGTKVLTGTLDKTAKLWDTATGAELRTFPGYAFGVHSVAFSPDGTKALLAGGDESPGAKVKLCDAATGADIRAFTGAVGPACSVAFSPDGTKVLAGSQAGEPGATVRLWDAATGVEIPIFTGGWNCVSSVAFSPDGTKVLAACGTAKLWDATKATGDDNSIQEAIKASKDRIAQVGAFSVSASVDIRDVLLDKDPNRVYELKRTFKAVVDGERLRETQTRQVIWFPDERSPAQILTRDDLTVYDGEKEVVYQAADEEAWIKLPHGSEAINPARLWITLGGGKSVDVLLAQTDCKCLGVQKLEGREYLAYEMSSIQPDGSPEPGMTCRLWLDPANEYYPVRMARGKMKGGELEVGYEVQTLKSEVGVLCPVDVVERLYAYPEGKKLMFTERLYHFTDFQPRVEINGDTFKIDLPKGTTVHDEIAGTTHQIDEWSAGVVREFRRMTKSAR